MRTKEIDILSTLEKMGKSQELFRRLKAQAIIVFKSYEENHTSYIRLSRIAMNNNNFNITFYIEQVEGCYLQTTEGVSCAQKRIKIPLTQFEEDATDEDLHQVIKIALNKKMGSIMTNIDNKNK